MSERDNITKLIEERGVQFRDFQIKNIEIRKDEDDDSDSDDNADYQTTFFDNKHTPYSD